MKKIVLPVLVLVLLSACSHKIYHALDWQSAKVKADGRILEWPDPLRFLDEKTKISYTISNDRKNLYVCMRIADPAQKMKIIHGGMEFRIDTLGKSTFPVAFIFPVANQIVMTHETKGESQSEDNPGGKPHRPAMMQRILSPANEVELIGFKHPLNGTLSLLNNNSGISAAITLDSLGILCYEAIIPFNTFYKNELTAADTSKVFDYEIKINALPAPPTHQQGSSGGENGGGMGSEHHGGGSGQHGGMGGGGSHGGEHRGGSGNYAANGDMFVASQIINKMKFSLK